MRISVTPVAREAEDKDTVRDELDAFWVDIAQKFATTPRHVRIARPWFPDFVKVIALCYQAFEYALTLISARFHASPIILIIGNPLSPNSSTSLSLSLQNTSLGMFSAIPFENTWTDAGHSPPRDTPSIVNLK